MTSPPGRDAATAAAAIVDAARGRTSKREVATRAGISEGWLRQVMAGGYERGGVWFPANASDETWLAIARAARADAAEVFAALGRDVPPPRVAEEPVGANLDPAIAGRIADLAPDELARVIGYIDSVIEGRPQP